MANPPNRVIYAGTDVLISDSPAINNQNGTYSLKRINNVQNTSVFLSYALNKTKHVGYSDYLYNTNILPPQVGCDITYISQNNSNELLLGLNASGDQLYSGIDQTGLDKNLFFIFDTGQTIRDVTAISDFNGEIQVLGLGNAYVSNYKASAAIGGLPEVTVSFVASNAVFQNYDSDSNNRRIPSLLSGNITDNTYTITSNNFQRSDYINNDGSEASAKYINAGDIVLELEDPNTGVGGFRFVSSGKIQNYNLEVPFQRRELLGFGSDYPFDRVIEYPVDGSLSMSVIFDGFNTGVQTGVNFRNKNYNFSIIYYDCDNNNTNLIYKINNPKLVSQSLGTQIGNSFIFEGQFSFEVNDVTGFYISGVSELS